MTSMLAQSDLQKMSCVIDIAQVSKWRYYSNNDRSDTIALYSTKYKTIEYILNIKCTVA